MTRPAGSASDAAIAFSDGVRRRGEDLFQCGPALTDKNDLKTILKFIPEIRFRNPGSKEYNRSNEK
jgi:hypothetical protein